MAMITYSQLKLKRGMFIFGLLLVFSLILILYWISLDQEFGSVWHLPINVPVIKISCFRQKDMYQYIAVVHCNPFCVSQSVYSRRLVIYFFMYIFLDWVNDSYNLTWGITLTDYEIAANGIINGGEVRYYNVFTFLFLNAFCYFFTKVSASFIIMLLTTDYSNICIYNNAQRYLVFSF